MTFTQIEPEELFKVFRQILKDELQIMNEARKVKTYNNKEACEALKVCGATLWKMRKRGEITPTMIGSKPVFTEEEIKRILNQKR